MVLRPECIPLYAKCHNSNIVQLKYLNNNALIITNILAKCGKIGGGAASQQEGANPYGSGRYNAMQPYNVIIYCFITKTAHTGLIFCKYIKYINVIIMHKLYV